MTRRKASSPQVSDGQVNVFGEIEGLENLVNKPSVVEANGLRVVQIVIPQHEVETPGYVDKALELARKLQPEVQSTSKPPWMDANWLMKRRKRKNNS